VRLERRLGGARARQQRPAQPRIAAEIGGVKEPQLRGALGRVGGPREQRGEPGERAHQDPFSCAHVVVGAETGLRVELARQPRPAAVQPAGRVGAIAVAGPAHVGQVEQRGVRRDQDGAEEHVLGLERVVPVDLFVVVLMRAQQLDQPQVPVVVPVRGPLRRVAELTGVEAGVRAWPGRLDARERAVPAR
jgi:hypothetical protein